MIKGSAITMVLDPSGEPDIKIATELGLSILLGKPIVLLITPGQVPNRGLVRVADAMIEADPNDPAGTAAQLREIMRQLGLHDDA